MIPCGDETSVSTPCDDQCCRLPLPPGSPLCDSYAYYSIPNACCAESLCESTASKPLASDSYLRVDYAVSPQSAAHINKDVQARR